MAIGSRPVLTIKIVLDCAVRPAGRAVGLAPGGQGTNKGSQSVGVLYGHEQESAQQERARIKAQFEALKAGGLKPKDLIGIPWRVAFALQQDGWYLRQDIIWHKPNPMPESVRDRCTKAHEYLFMLSKSAKYYYDADAIKEKAVRGYAGSNFHTGKTAKHQLDRASKKPRVGNKQDGVGKRQYSGFNARYDDSNPPEFRNRRSVWTITTKPFKEAHFATFPPDLVEPCILAGCPQNGIVLDPFGGAGTTGLVARQHGRRAVLMELNPSYVDIANRRLFGDIKQAAE